MPILAIAIATGAAFANAAVTKPGSALIDRQGYVKVSASVCTPTQILCSTTQHQFMCSNGTVDLFDWNGTACPNALFYRP